MSKKALTLFEADDIIFFADANDINKQNIKNLEN
jgi:hypothetical protein